MDRATLAEGEAGWVVWVTGRPQSGKSSFARALAQALRDAACPALVLDGDEVRAAVVPPFGYDEVGRDAFYATLARLAATLARQPVVVVVAATAHERRFRARARDAASGRFIEVFTAADEAICRGRDRKGLYRAADSGGAPAVAAATLSYEPPESPDVVAQGGEDHAAVARARDLVLARAGTRLATRSP
jgi:adenylylsulfate kinase